ncbi:ribonuclease P [Candidatus Woesearchaeota archaeon]|nr:ribonuclease P [Candidatus Woesearchaeota archaeon]
MRKKYKGTLKQQKILALEEIKKLFAEAKKAFDENPDLADKYAKKARRTAMKYKVNLPLTLKRRICKNCRSYLVPGRNCRVRTHKGHMVYYCLNCKGFMRIGYK